MSSILKALEKAEDAQNQKRNPGAGGLGRKRERRPAWLIPVWSLGGAAVATLVTYSIMGGFGKSAPPAAQVVATAPQPPAQPVAPVAKAAVPAASAPTAPAATAKPVAPAPVKPLAAPVAVKPQQTRHEVKAPVRKQQVASVPKPAVKPAAKPQRSKVPAPPVPVRPAAVHAAPALAAPVAAQPARAVSSEKPHQDIRVTGIAWQNDSQSSFAMVNGRPVRQGAVVDGYKVEQIFEDSVKFSGSKGPVTIPLGASEQ
jgi:general secretion pathway protein B